MGSPGVMGISISLLVAGGSRRIRNLSLSSTEFGTSLGYVTPIRRNLSEEERGEGRGSGVGGPEQRFSDNLCKEEMCLLEWEVNRCK